MAVVTRHQPIPFPDFRDRYIRRNMAAVFTLHHRSIPRQLSRARRIEVRSQQAPLDFPFQSGPDVENRDNVEVSWDDGRL